MTQTILTLACAEIGVACGCDEDSDCEGDRVCELGDCAAPGPLAPITAGPSGGPGPIPTGEDDASDGEASDDDTQQDTGLETTGDTSECAVEGQSGAMPGSGCYSFADAFQTWLDGLAGFWGTDPALVCVYEQSATTSCGYLGIGAFYCPFKDAILIENGFGTYVESVFPYGVAAILAHEWGHKNQAALGYGATNKWMELQADCQAGIFAGVRDAMRPPEAHMHEDGLGVSCLFADASYSVWWDPAAHGTCPERQCAFEEGWQAGFDGEACGLAEADQFCTAVASACAL